MANMTIRLRAKSRGVPLWKVADALGISEPTLFRWLRRELPKEKCEEILGIIDRLAKKHR